MNVIPPYTGNPELDTFLYDLALNGSGAGSATNTVIPDTGGGALTEYPYRYIHIKYADSNTGEGFSNVQTYKTFFGIFNSETTTESTNPADYTWYQVANGFGTQRSLYYKPLGARSVKFAVDVNAPDTTWKVDPSVAVDLDIIIPPLTISANEVLDSAITELKIANAAITAAKTNVAALDQISGNLNPNTVTATQIEANAVTTDKIAANAITANKISVSQLSAITANMGTITAGTIRLPATGNTYLIIDGANNRIDVYDNGVLRVRLGNLV